ncbi:MAG: Sua5/YciO/YrdC/YwlC family protein [Bacteroidota bacterium]
MKTSKGAKNFNPEQTRVIDQCVDVLKKDGLMLYLTDTVWCIGCDATNPKAVNGAYHLKKRSDRALTCLVADQAMLERHVEKVPDAAYDIIDFATKPITIIYDSPKDIAKNLITNNTLAIRVASDTFCRYLINTFKKPIVATPANSYGSTVPRLLSDITPEILKGVDYVVNLQEKEPKNTPPPSIIKLGNDGTVKVIRE